MMDRSAAERVYLSAYLRPLEPWLAQPDVTDIMINRPGEVWVERLGRPPERHVSVALSEMALNRLAAQIAAGVHQGIGRQSPLLSATLPDGARVQIVSPPATRGSTVLAFRKQVVRHLGLDDYERSGMFEDAHRLNVEVPSEEGMELKALLDQRRLKAFFRLAIRQRKNIIVSGGTATGKTTFLNALLQEVPAEERIVAIEDAAEVRLDHPNAVGLLSARDPFGESGVSMEDLLQASLRLRPDRIILGELRGKEAYSFLRAVNSGHPGSITTVHSDTPRGALDQIALMVLQTGVSLSRGEIIDYVLGVVDITVQLSRRDGQRSVTGVVLHER